MDERITLTFDGKTIAKAKKFAGEHHLSLSRLTEYLYNKIANEKYQHLEEIPVADWINQLAEGEVEYRRTPRSRKSSKQEFLKDRK